MRNALMRSVLAVTAAAALVASATLASAQGPVGPGGGGGQHMRQGPAGGGGGGPRGGVSGGGGHAPSMGTQSRGGGQSGGFAQSHRPSQAGPMHVQRGPSHGPQHMTRGERSRGGETRALHSQRGQALAEQRHRGKSLAEQRHRGKALAEQRHRGQTLAEQRRMHGQNLKTTSKTGTQTRATRTERGKQAFAQAGTRSKISLTSQQRARIHNVVLHRDFSRLRVRHVNFAIRIGVFVPRSFTLFVIPEDIVVIVPQFRRFRCFIFGDELVIVDPFTFEIVAIIPV
jgi:hypothetical protein